MEKVTTLKRVKGTKRFTKLKINITDDIDKNIDKIIKFIFKDLIVENVDLSKFSEYFNFKNFKLAGIAELTKYESSMIRNSFCSDKENFYQAYELCILDNNANEFKVLTNCIDISKRSRKTIFWSFKRSDRYYQKICDLKYLYGLLKVLEITYEYCYSEGIEKFNNYSEISLFGNSYSEDDINSLIDFKSILGNRGLFKLSNTTKQLIIDIALNKQLEDLNVELMNKYDKDIQNQVARSFETKKNIPEKIKIIMNSNKFLNYFTYVEMDSETDIKNFRLVENEWVRVSEIFNLTKLDKRPELRFRKLGKHKALGLYYPGLKCMCVDITSPSSFLHEFGHHIDFTYSDRPLSLKGEFMPILREYAKQYDLQRNEDSYLYNKRNYFITPTEVFAITFEIYLVKKGVQTSFLKDEEDMKINSGYPAFDDEGINRIIEYFDNFNFNFEKINEIDKVGIIELKDKIFSDTINEIKYTALKQVCFF